MKIRKNRKPKILIVSDYFYPHWTGIAKAFLYTVIYLHKKYDFTVLTVRHEDALKKNETIYSTKIKRYNYFFSFSRSKYSLSLLGGFIQEARRHDLIIINSPCVNILPISFLSKLFSKKFLVYHQGDLILPKGLLNHVIEKLFDISTLISFYLADIISTNTADYAHNSRVMRHFLHKCFPVLLPILKRNKKRTKIFELERIKKSKYTIIGFGGRFVEEKGYDILFDAIRIVIKKMPKLHFVFAGETNMKYEDFYSKNLQRIKKVKQNITFLGLLEEDVLPTFYSYLDFLVVPSRSDCFSLMQAEAMIYGVPSIVSDIPGARFLVKRTGFGTTFKKENAKDLAGKIIHAIHNKKKMIRCKPYVEKILDNKKNSKKIMYIINSSL
ncbi:MAG: hypothetical protein A3F31_01110 [Candidatus Levybacteria bacterium RIFCSPHIGHO2_12_FULL_38_12]|nr:MAG: hypothetical protein A2770_01820 [Candidatus Levybacteria bacterium RIFCSPHIGHO2_01_FULL_38_12]OGH22034.1 MAG: hypothetical protein A3D75_03350 [Candidatus Levybacteria bacterium RIFCSPHIGHO2_02_FULL_37_18]OGH23248.1 MAG: hypothetical protein A3F31_01110 [Candidatus Levybacteria bacterium RIFCSPHIGHO2_12_FULL_38_12]OGH33727.1 MAG: hypothetical protein A3A47_02785 [Candidatus Levybacteria bacterium RIFCSPLOWO2_01_FULL_37_20]OGH44633.1 MAG: hypothetical protein A3J14_00870 [Candidatus Lev